MIMMMIFWLMMSCSLVYLKMETVCFAETSVHLTQMEETGNEYRTT
jgi:hypothetical protein